MNIISIEFVNFGEISISDSHNDNGQRQILIRNLHDLVLCLFHIADNAVRQNQQNEILDFVVVLNLHRLTNLCINDREHSEGG